ncbi:MAG: PDZ domain-containing protein [Firmicutes bacterium]|nr:PDZ domain-containing protein [Bacillota bacterium]
MFTKIYESTKQFIKENYKFLISILVIFLLFNIELPYSIYTPGGTVNLNKRIEIENEEEVTGSFNMAYVSMVKGSVPFLLLSKVIPDWDIVKKEDITIDDESMDELLERERLYLEESIDNAIINAYKKANEEISIKNINNSVSYITDAAKTNLEIGDNIISVNDFKINSLDELKNIIEKLDENVKVNLRISRDGKEKNAYATTYKTEDGMKIGVMLITTYDYETDPDINVKTKSSEAGSSGGLMLSLTIYNKLVKEDITKGKKIVGTGTIDINGNVGEIGGVKYKLMGAVKNDADIFMCPEENYEEAMKVAKEKDYNIKIISVKTFDEALQKLSQ